MQLFLPSRAIKIFIYLFIFLNFTNLKKLLLGFSIFITHFSELNIFIESNTYEYFPLPIFRSHK